MIRTAANSYPAELTIARENGEPHTIPVTLGARGPSAGWPERASTSRFG